MHYQPYCIKKRHKCKNVCVSKTCEVQNPFICSECPSHHKKQCQVIAYAQLVKIIHIKQGLNTKAYIKFEQNVEQTFRVMIKSLQAEFVKFRQMFQHLNASPKIKQFYQLLKSHKERHLTANKINEILDQQILTKKYKLKSQANIWRLSKEIIQLQQKVNSKLPYYYDIYGQELQNSLQVEQKDEAFKEVQIKYRRYKENIVGCILEYSMDAVQKLFQRKIYNVQLLYKATKYNFSAQKFHEICDGKKNTLTIAKTEFGRIIGGFCAPAWKSPSTWHYQSDNSDYTFIFSLSKYFQGHKFRPFKKQFSIGMHKEYGPCFGDDFVIYDKANTSKGCWSNFPDCYKSQTKQFPHDKKAILQFIGVDDHYKKFNLLEWQVYKISFNASEQQQAIFMKQYRKI